MSRRFLGAGVISCVASEAVWISPNVEAARFQEKNFGAGILSIMAVYASLALIPMRAVSHYHVIPRLATFRPCSAPKMMAGSVKRQFGILNWLLLFCFASGGLLIGLIRRWSILGRAFRLNLLGVKYAVGAIRSFHQCLRVVLESIGWWLGPSVCNR